MRVDLLTREYPPEVYGGAGVHVGELVTALRRELDVVVRCFGAPRSEPDVYPYLVPPELVSANPSIAALAVDLRMAQDVAGADLVHSHTWYANAAGHIAKLLHGVPHVVTAHRVSSAIEETGMRTADAVIAVSHGMRNDILSSYAGIDESKVHVVHNGIDLERWYARPDTEHARSLGIDPDRPAVVFVGRITRQKGLTYLLRAARDLPKDVREHKRTLAGIASRNKLPRSIAHSPRNARPDLRPSSLGLRIWPAFFSSMMSPWFAAAIRFWTP